jgi:dephospho-CoA kinase
MTGQHQSEATSVVPRRIVLTGFMGSGKTTVGPLVARRLGWKFVDVDDAIEAEAGVTIAELFSATARRPSASASARPLRLWLLATRWFWPWAAAPSSTQPRAICC